MTSRALLGIGFMCVAMAACSDDESVAPPTTAPVVKAAGQAASDVSRVVVSAEWKAVIEDWYVDGSFNSPHRCAAVRLAIERLPTSPRDYSTVYKDMRRLERTVCG